MQFNFLKSIGCTGNCIHKAKSGIYDFEQLPLQIVIWYFKKGYSNKYLQSSFKSKKKMNWITLIVYSLFKLTVKYTNALHISKKITKAVGWVPEIKSFELVNEEISAVFDFDRVSSRTITGKSDFTSSQSLAYTNGRYRS